MNTGCPTCGDTLQGVMCEVPDHGQKRDLMIDWCMDCLQAKRFTLSAPKAPPDNVTIGVFDPDAPAGIRTSPGGVIHGDPPGPANAGTGSLAHQEGGALHPESCTYLGAGGLIKIEVQPGVLYAQLRQARRFLDALIDLEGKAP